MMYVKDAQGRKVHIRPVPDSMVFDLVADIGVIASIGPFFPGTPPEAIRDAAHDRAAREAWWGSERPPKIEAHSQPPQ